MLEPLEAFLDEHGLGAGEIEAQPDRRGPLERHLPDRAAATAELVLRRPPRPPLPPSAHDVLREARLLRALATPPRACPAVLAVCDDDAIDRRPFYVMERIEGEVIVASIPPALDTPAERAADRRAS